MTIQRERFWMVWSPQGRTPSHKHFSREEADDEAKRLSRVTPSQEFFVLKAMAGFVRVPIVPEEPERIEMIGGDGIPF